MKPIIDITPVINCSGKMTYLGSSVLSDEVLDSMSTVAKSYYDMNDLHTKAYAYLAKCSGAQGGYITLGASSGIIAATAAMVTRGNLYLVEEVPNVNTEKKTCIIQKGHAIHFGAKLTQMIEIGGGKVLEVGTVNKCLDYHLKEAIDETTCAIFYVQSHHAVQDGMLSLEKTIEIAHQHDIPVIVDAAAEEDFKKYVNMDADLVIYSGAKAFSGPTSGCVVGKKPYIDWCVEQNIGIMRAMKVGKETISGLLCAIDQQSKTTKTIDTQEALLQPLYNYLSELSGCKVTFNKDSVGREISRLRLSINDKEFPWSAVQFSQLLKQQDPAVYTRDHHAENGYIEFDARPMKESDAVMIIEIIENMLKESE